MFRKKHKGGVPALAPHTHQPVSTTRERELFAELMPQYGGFSARPNFKGMTADWNQRFVLQTLPGSPGQPLTAVQNDTMIWSKTHKHLRKFFEEWRQSLRDQQNAQLNAQIQKSPLPPTADLNLDMQANISTFFRPTPAAATSAPSPGQAQDVSSLTDLLTCPSMMQPKGIEPSPVPAQQPMQTVSRRPPQLRDSRSMPPSSLASLWTLLPTLSHLPLDPPLCSVLCLEFRQL